MPDEPNRNIEEQLRTWAQTRREEAGAPIELHPATRKLLQDEVTRTYANRAEKSEKKSAWLALLWPRFAVALPVVAVVAVMLALLVPSLSKPGLKGQQTFEVAQQSKKLSVEELERSDAAKREEFGESVRLRDEGAKMPAPSAGAVPALDTERPYSEKRSKDSVSVKSGRDASAESDVRKNPELAAVDKTKEAVAPLAQATPATRGLNVENERGEVLLRQRYGLAPEQREKTDESPPMRARSVSAQQASTPKATAGGRPIAETQPALQTVRGGVDGGQATDRFATAGVPDSGVEQKVANADALTLALKPSEERVVAEQTVSLGKQGQGARAEQVAALAYFADLRGGATQRFAQTQNYRRNFNSPPPPNVLNSFQFEQTGRQVRIVDVDGSAYEGQIEEPKSEVDTRARFAAAAAVELKRAQTDGANQAQLAEHDNTANRNVWFRVAGTNRTLSQPVVFVGNLLVEDSNAPGSAPNGAGAGVTLAPQSPTLPAQNAPLQNQLLRQNARVQGQVTIGASNRIEIDATAITP